MANKRTVDVSAEIETLPEHLRRKIPMTDIKQVSPSELHTNKKNTEYFGQEDDQHVQQLREDIRKRGIIVPLIAKRDGTLLAGHNRLLIAQELHLKYVPLQYVQEELTEEREREFIVKDNLLRRQLSVEKRINLYKVLYPEFEKTYLDVENPSVGGRTKQNDTNRLTIGRIAKETGQKENTVKKQIKEARKKRRHQVPALTVTTEQQKRGDRVPPSENEKKISTSTLPRARKILRELEQTIESASMEEQEEIYSLLRRYLEKQSKS